METNAVQSAMNNVQEASSSISEWIGIALKFFAEFGLRIIAAILIFVIGRWVAKQVHKLLHKMMERAKVDSAVIGFTCSLAHAAIMVFVILAALGKVGVQTASFIAVLAAAGFAVGLALQGSLSNFASGVLLMIFRPFHAGDYIEGGGVSGVVKAIHIFTTTLTTPDNKRVIVPNSKIMGDNIVNYSAEGTRRLDLVASISYNDDIDKAKAILAEIVAKEERVLKDPSVTIGVVAMGESSIDIVVRPWVSVVDYWAVHFALTEAIKKGLEAGGCSIPYPQRDVHLYKHDAE